MSIVAAVLAAGSSKRFGSDKTESILGGRPVWRWSVDTFLSHPEIDRVVLVTSLAKVQGLKDAVGDRVFVIAGGETRQQSSFAALQAALDAEILLIHDAARPFVSLELISNAIEAIHRSGAAGVATKVTDTIKQIGPDNSVTTIDRDRLVAMQTPQGARVELLRTAHASASQDFTDEMALIEAFGVHPEIVPGEPNNFKITTPEDMVRALQLVGQPETRVGIGYDIHPFSDDPLRPLYLGGVHFPGHRALEGHSDADVLLHAATDAILGAAGLGDIGQHFPNTDPRWRGEPSLTFLRHARSLLAADGWRIVNLDLTAIAESPKIMKRADDIRSTIAGALEIDSSRVSIKATTNEQLGAIGRSEGIAALATVSIAR